PAVQQRLGHLSGGRTAVQRAGGTGADRRCGDPACRCRPKRRGHGRHDRRPGAIRASTGPRRGGRGGPAPHLAPAPPPAIARRAPTLWARLASGLVVMAVGVYRAIDQHRSGSAPRGVRTDSVTFFISLAIAAYILTVFLAPRLVNREGRALYLLALAPVSPRTI